MSIESNELIDSSELYFFVGDRDPNDDDISRARRLGAKLISLSPTRLVELYEVWEICHREIDNEPFIANLVRSQANLDTLSDLSLDIAEESLERGHNRYGYDVTDLIEIIELEGTKQHLFPEHSADSIPALDLARFVLGITVVHPAKEVELFDAGQFYLAGNLEDPEFLERLSSRYIEFERTRVRSTEYLDVSLDDLLESEEDDKKLALAERSHKFETYKNVTHGKVVKLVDVELFLEDQIELAIDTITTLHATRQLEREAEEFGFKLVQRTS